MFIIAEIAQAHEGSLGIAHSYIDALAKTGVDAIKFQTHISEAESTKYEPFRIKFSYKDETRFDYWKRMEFTLDEWMSLKEHCDNAGIEFMSSPFSNAAVDLLEKIGVKRYKIGSGEVSNLLLLEKIRKTGKPVIISSGMSSFDELDKTVLFLNSSKMDYSILQATTAYPTQAENYGLNLIHEFKRKYGVPIGYSDHSAKIEVGIAAFSLGAEILEFHVTFDRDMFGPDSKASLTISETKILVDSIRNLEKAYNNPVNKENAEIFSDLKKIFEKSLAINKYVEKGHIISFEDLEAKKPKGYGINAYEYEKIIGKTINRNMNKWDFINVTDIDEND